MTTNGPLEPEAVLHPALEDRRPERRDHLQPRQRRPRRRPAGRHRRRASSSSRGSASSRPTTPTSRRSLAVVDSVIARSRRDGHRLLPVRHAADRHRGRLRRLPRRRPDRLHGRGQAVGRRLPEARARTRARGTSGRCCPASGPSTQIATGTRGDGCALLGAMAETASGVGLVPEQAWENADLRRVAVRHATRSAPRSASSTARPPAARSPLTWSAGPVRAAVARPAGRPDHRAPVDTVARYIDHTQPGTTVTLTAPADTVARRRDHDGVGTHDARVDRRRHAVNTDVARRDHDAPRPRPATDGSFTVAVAGPAGHRRAHRRRRRRRAARPASPSARSCNDVVPGTLVFEVDRPRRRRQRPGHVRLSDLRQTSSRAPTTCSVRGLRHRRRHGHLPGADPRPDADVRQPARAPSSSTSTSTQPGRRADVDGRVVPAAQLPDRADSAWNRLIEVAGLRPALRRRQRRHGRLGRPSAATRSPGTSRSR